MIELQLWGSVGQAGSPPAHGRRPFCCDRPGLGIMMKVPDGRDAGGIPWLHLQAILPK